MVWATTRRPRRGEGARDRGLRWGGAARRRALRHLPDAPASRCLPRLPGGPLRPMRWVIIIEIWYQFITSNSIAASGYKRVQCRETGHLRISSDKALGVAGPEALEAQRQPNRRSISASSFTALGSRKHRKAGIEILRWEG